jgi:hypothetical protein
MTLIQISQLIISLSVILVWTLRYNAVKRDFEQFGLTNVVRNIVGVTKLLTSFLLILGLWFPETTIVSCSIMCVFMLAAQYFHWSVNNPIIKKAPSIVLFSLCVIVLINNI